MTKAMINTCKRVCLGIFAIFAFALVGFLFVRMWLFGGPYLPTESVPSNKSLVDLHVHTACLESATSGCFISESLRDSAKFPLYLRAFGVNRKELEATDSRIVVNKIARRVMESKYLSHAVVLSIDAAITDTGQIDRAHTELYVPTEYVADAIRPFPQLLLGASVNPMRADALERLEWAKNRGAVLIKWLPSIQNFDPANSKFIPFYRKLVELDLPLLSHTGHERAFSQANNAFADPQRLTLALNQGVTVIAAHVASTGQNEGEDNIDRLYALMAKYPNLYTELSSLTQINKIGYMRKLLNQYGYLERVAYGSDAPLVNTALVSPFYYPMQLTIENMLRISSIDNMFDRDIELKLALGVPSRVFYLSRKLIDHNLPEESNIQLAPE